MTITLNLNPEEMRALTDRARAQGVDVEAVLHDLLAKIAPPPSPQERSELTEKQKGLAALMRAFHEEDQTDDPEELDRRDRELEESKANINRWRAEQGRPPAD